MRHKNKIIKIGKKLKQARISCGYTQEQVCEILECAPRYVGQLETNQTVGSISFIIDLCSLYKITLNDLYSDYIKQDNNLDLTKISGYFNLNEEYRSIIDNNISFLNKLQNKKN